MKINLKQAVKYFFSNPSLELVYIEAVANSIDAGATEIDINISIEEVSKPETLEITIKDNGGGFTNERFEKFSRLMEVEEDSHKGLGRLVFLSYFKKVEIESYFDKQVRRFEYSTDFDEESMELEKTDEAKNETVLKFKKYFLKKLGKHDYVKPSYLRDRLLEEFYPRLYLMKQEGKELKISIGLSLQSNDNRFDVVSDKRVISVQEIETLQIEPIDASVIEMFQNMELHYSIKEKPMEKTIVTALCIDGRTYKMDIVSDENLPMGYEMIFLLYSSYFDGKVNASRQELTLSDKDKKQISQLFRSKVSEVLGEKIPTIVENNKKTQESLENTFPHLLGYFENETIGFIKRDDSIKKAQEKLFKEQKKILECKHLSDEDYKKTLDLSSRALTEYVLYRQHIIERLKEIDTDNSEADIHNLIVPMGKVYQQNDGIEDLYGNNAWLLDDKFMTYKTILSDKVMSEVVKQITDEEAETDNNEPDITLIFSNNPEEVEKVDVVIVELKKRGLKLEDNVTVITQLKKRATKLMALYPDKIQRIWFYAVVEFDDEFKLYLENDRFTALYSTDTMYYKEDEIKTSLDSPLKAPIGMFILSLDSFINDADIRNSTFLKVLKSGFKNNQ